jgi:hypothetical protein
VHARPGDPIFTKGPFVARAAGDVVEEGRLEALAGQGLEAVQVQDIDHRVRRT